MRIALLTTLPFGLISNSYFAHAETNATNNQLSQSINSSGAAATVTEAAFPGAQGGGAISVGGRGGAIIEVTNLNDSGAGSLRACLLATMPRTCVFRVGGTIQLNTHLAVRSPYLTVAGQTAPGGGILISGKGMADNVVGIATHDVIWQYTRIRKGYSVGCSNSTTSDCGAALNLWSGSYNVMLDHNSTSWNQDEGIGIYDNDATRNRIKNVTASYNLIAEGLVSHSTGFLTGGVSTLAAQMTDIDLHHNLMMNDSHRNPLLLNKSSRLVNNIYYNQGYYINQVGGGISADIIGNLYKLGPLNTSWVHEIQGFTAADTNVSPGSPSIYLFGNKGYHQTNPAGNQWVMASKVIGENGSDSAGTPIPSDWRRGTPIADTKYPISAQSVADIEDSIVPIVGASRKLACNGAWIDNRDSVDTRLIDQYSTDTGIIELPSNESAVGGFPVIADGTPCTDTDHDGMPDMWEISRGLDPDDAADRNYVSDNGYTNVQNYLGGV